MDLSTWKYLDDHQQVLRITLFPYKGQGHQRPILSAVQAPLERIS